MPYPSLPGPEAPLVRLIAIRGGQAKSKNLVWAGGIRCAALKSLHGWRDFVGNVGIVVIAVIALPLTACGRIGVAVADVDQVRHTDERRRIAQLNGDVALLERLIADDATLVYGDGTTETKASLLAQIRSGKLRWTKSEYDPSQVRVYGKVAVVTGTARSSINGGPQHTAYVTRVYAMQHGSWQLIASQTTRTDGSS